MKLSRRTVVATALASPLILRTARAADDLRARIKVNTENTRGPIDPKLYGNFIEHLGRCIDGGIFEEGSPLSDAAGSARRARGRAEAERDACCAGPAATSPRTTTGGTASARATSGRRASRWRGARWRATASARTSSCDYAEQLKTEPYICANLGTGTWTEAQQWVEYCNSAEDTAMTRLRQQNGRAEPWKVKYWGLGNEMDGPWQMGHRSAEDYGKFALEAAKLMKWTDPNIKLIAAGSSNFGPGVDWTAVESHRARVPARITPTTSRSTCTSATATNDFGDFMASSSDSDARTKTARRHHRRRARGPPGDRKIYIAWDEWNVWYRARGNTAARPPHPRGALQPRGRAGDRHVPQLVRQPRRTS